MYLCSDESQQWPGPAYPNALRLHDPPWSCLCLSQLAGSHADFGVQGMRNLIPTCMSLSLPLSLSLYILALSFSLSTSWIVSQHMSVTSNLAPDCVRSSAEALNPTPPKP